jgi:hypothetical protein
MPCAVFASVLRGASRIPPNPEHGFHDAVGVGVGVGAGAWDGVINSSPAWQRIDAASDAVLSAPTAAASEAHIGAVLQLNLTARVAGVVVALRHTSPLRLFVNGVVVASAQEPTSGRTRVFVHRSALVEGGNAIGVQLTATSGESCSTLRSTSRQSPVQPAPSCSL